MSQANLRVMVVDDDFMIAKVHGKYIDLQEGYELVGIAGNYEQTLAGVKQCKPELLLLDVYLPDRSGVEVLRTIRAEKIPCDVILITAAKELDIIEDSFRMGIFDYLIKPFDLDLLRDSLEKYRQFKSHLQTQALPDQKFVEGLKKFRAAKPTVSQQMHHKGIDSRTLERIRQCLHADSQPCSAEHIAHLAGVSRSTARSYLEYMVMQGMADEILQYGTVGRPQKLFHLK